MNTNIEAYDILSRYYDKIYNYQTGDKSSDELNSFISKLLKYVNKKNNFLDVGCGTGIYTNIIYKYFKKSLGIDPCESMIQKCKNKDIEFNCLFLNKLSKKRYNFISAFSQIMNHLLTIEILENFIKDVSIRLEDNGIFYFDVFNYDFFLKNDPLNESRNLSKNTKYIIKPKIDLKSDTHINMILSNELVDGDKTYPYTLSMNIWNLNLIEGLCNKYNIKIIKKFRLFDLSNENILEYPKISVICSKIYA